jgi:molybdopterin-guanine dinucleotide biosynthesis protein A
MSVVGFAVAGGRSRRMGRDKALLPWGETDLLGHTLARLLAVTPDVRILCGPELRYQDRGVPVDVDLIEDAGPIGGVLTGLGVAAGRPGLFLAVDLPLVPVPLLRRLLDLLDGYDAVVPVSAGGAEPLCAVYGPGCLEPIRRLVATGEFGMRAFWPDARVRAVRSEELGVLGFSECFLNVNRPQDLGSDLK